MATLNPSAYLADVGKAILSEARARIGGSATGRAALAISITSVSDTQLVITAGPPAAYLMDGWPRQQMTWLAGKRIRFTPRGSSAPIIRTVSQKSLAAGKWVRPQRAPNPVFDTAWAAPTVQQSVADAVSSLAASLVAESSQSGARWAAPSPSAPGISGGPTLSGNLWGGP